jgi:hypothetical protein
METGANRLKSLEILNVFGLNCQIFRWPVMLAFERLDRYLVHFTLTLVPATIGELE